MKRKTKRLLSGMLALVLCVSLMQDYAIAGV